MRHKHYCKSDTVWECLKSSKLFFCRNSHIATLKAVVKNLHLTSLKETRIYSCVNRAKKFMFNSIGGQYFVDRLSIAYMDKILVSILIATLNMPMVSNFFICVSIRSQILGLGYLALLEPWLAVLTIEISKYVQYLRLYWFWCLSENILFIIVVEMPWYIFYIAVARTIRFLSWTETELSISTNSSKEDFWFCHYILKEDIFREAYLFCYFLCGYDTFKLTGNN